MKSPERWAKMFHECYGELVAEPGKGCAMWDGTGSEYRDSMVEAFRKVGASIKSEGYDQGYTDGASDEKMRGEARTPKPKPYCQKCGVVTTVLETNRGAFLCECGEILVDRMNKLRG
jgi:hypothetical protein